MNDDLGRPSKRKRRQKACTGTALVAACWVLFASSVRCGASPASPRRCLAPESRVHSQKSGPSFEPESQDIVDLDERDLVHDIKNLLLVAVNRSEKILGLFDSGAAAEAQAFDLEKERVFFEEYRDLVFPLYSEAVEYLKGSGTAREGVLKPFVESLDSLVTLNRGLSKRISRYREGAAPKMDAYCNQLFGVSREAAELIGVARTGLKTRAMSRSHVPNLLKRAVHDARILPPVHENAVEIELADFPESLSLLEDAFTYTSILRNAVVEFAGNAARHSGSARVRIEPFFEQGQLGVRVQDWGKGMSPRELEESFKPGFTRSDQGTGWGLPTLENSIHAVGGRLGILSRGRNRADYAVYGDSGLFERELERIARGDSPLAQGTLAVWTLPVNPNRNQSRIFDTPFSAKVCLLVSGLGGTGRRVLSRLLSSLLGLRYYNGGFLLRMMVFDLLRHKDKAAFEQGDAFNAAIREAAASIDLSAEPVSYRGEPTAAKTFLELRRSVWELVDGNAENTLLMHRLASTDDVQRVMDEKHFEMLGSIEQTHDYAGLCVRVTDPREFRIPEDGGFASWERYAFYLEADPEVRALRTGRPGLDSLDGATRRSLVESGPASKDVSRVATYDAALRRNRRVWDVARAVLKEIHARTPDASLKKHLESVLEWKNGTFRRSARVPGAQGSGLNGRSTSKAIGRSG